MRMILLAQLRGIMALLEAMPRFPIPDPILPAKLDIPEDVLSGLYPHTEEEYTKWLKDGWDSIQTESGPGNNPAFGTKIASYEHYINNRLYPKLLEAGYHHITGLQTEDDETTQLLLDENLLDLGLTQNIILDIPRDGLHLDELDGVLEPIDAESVLERIQRYVEALFNYDLLNAPRIAFDYGVRLHLYTNTRDGWIVTPLGQALRGLTDAEAVGFLLILETARAFLDQDNWFISRERLQWLVDETPMHFSIHSPAEETPRLADLNCDDSWLRRLSWLGVVDCTVDYDPDEFDITDFNLRTVELNPFGRSLSEAILGTWNQESGGASSPSFLRIAAGEQPGSLRQIIDSLFSLDILPDQTG